MTRKGVARSVAQRLGFRLLDDSNVDHQLLPNALTYSLRGERRTEGNERYDLARSDSNRSNRRVANHDRFAPSSSKRNTSRYATDRSAPSPNGLRPSESRITRNEGEWVDCRLVGRVADGESRLRAICFAVARSRGFLREVARSFSNTHTVTVCESRMESPGAFAGCLRGRSLRSYCRA